MSKIPDNIKKMWEEAASRGKDSKAIGKMGDKKEPHPYHKDPKAIGKIGDKK